MKRVSIAWMSVFVVLAGCGKQEPAPQPPPLPPPEPQTEFSFTETEEEVAAEAIKPHKEIKSVEADFNRDGFPDLAVVELNAEGRKQVSIYIRKAVSPDSDLGEVVRYYRGGAVLPPSEGSIIGIMTRSGRERGLTDLILLVGYADTPNVMYHLENDGERFSISGETGRGDAP